MRRSRLDLPEPLGPVRSSAPPGGRAKSRPAKTSRPPRRHCRDRTSKSPWSGLLCPERTAAAVRSEEHTSELQSLMRISYVVFCLIKKTKRPSIHKQETYHTTK